MNRTGSAAETGPSGFQSSIFPSLKQSTKWAHGVESRILTVVESQFSDICDTDVVFYTQCVKDGNFYKIRCSLSVQPCISSATISKSFTGREFVERTTSV